MKKIISFVLCVIFLMGTVTSALAANVCGNIGGNATAEKTFTINTGSRWLFSDKIKFEQTKGIYEYRSLFTISKTKTGYMSYRVYYRIEGESSWSTKEWKGKTLNLSLKKNQVYEVRVVPYDNVDMTFSSGKQIISWKKVATWKVTSTKGILSCQ